MRRIGTALASALLLVLSLVPARPVLARRSLPPGIVPTASYIEPDDTVRPLTRLIDAAQRTIFVEAYILSDTSVIRALDRASAQGVTVDVLLEHRPFGLGTFSERIALELKAAGIGVRWGSSRFTYTHAKFLVVDDRRAIVSTANFSRSGFDTNREVLIEDDAPADVRDLSNIFRADWDRVSPTLRSPNLVISPVNGRSLIEALLRSARSRVDIYAEEMQDPAVERLLLALRRRGVRVRALLPPPLSPSVPVALRPIMRTLAQPYIHAKVIAVDGREAFVGSENLSSTSLDDNREVGLLVRGPLLRRLHGIFDVDWSRGS